MRKKVLTTITAAVLAGASAAPALAGGMYTPDLEGKGSIPPPGAVTGRVPAQSSYGAIQPPLYTIAPVYAAPRSAVIVEHY